MIKVLVTGSNGQVGSEIKALEEQHPDIKFLFTTRNKLDISSEESIDKIIAGFQPNYLINAAAYTAVDNAEKDLNKARLVNAQAVEYLAKACRKNNVWLMHISTDYVYHLITETPLREDYMTQAQGVYAKTKLEGENLILSSDVDHCILRTSWVYSSYGHNFVKTMLRLGASKETLTIVADQIGSPTYAKDIAEALIAMINTIDTSNNKTQLKGIFNYSNEGITHWADFARKIFEIENIECLVKESTTEEYGAPAPRPKWSVLDKSKISKVFGIEPIDWEDSLRECLQLLRQQSVT